MEAHSHGGDVPVQSRAERFRSFAVQDFPVPTGREEDWRFTPLERLRGLQEGAAAEGPEPLIEVDPAPGVGVEWVSRDDERLGQAGIPEDRVAAQAWSSTEKALLLTVPTADLDGASAGVAGAARSDGAGAPSSQLTAVRWEGRGGTSYGHVAIRAERHAAGVVLLDHRGSGALAANVEIDLADGAQLTVVSVQDWADDAVHLTAHHARLGRDARLKHVVVTLGGDLVRMTPSAAFTAPGGDVELLGLYFADAGQHLEHRLYVDHAAPHCRSQVTYKGALQGQDAHTVWIGDVLIRALAEGTDTYELNRNLVLTDGARADSVPNLEIETGEIIGAGHASATGRFDDEQLFYLQARGIPELEARRLVVRGFFVELIQQIGVPALQERLLAAIEAELAAAISAAVDQPPTLAAAEGVPA